MSQLNYQADFNDVDTGDYTPIPPGKYQVTCVESELNQTKSGNGSYIKMVFEVMGGQYSGRKVYHNITFSNPSAKAQEIGRKQLNGYMLACNIQQVQDTAQLTGYAVIANVKIKDDPTYGKQNAISGFESASGIPLQQQPAQQPQPTAAQPPTQPTQLQAQPGYAVNSLDDDMPF